MTYLERYRAGEYEHVHLELVLQGSTIWSSSLYEDAYAVAQEIMSRVHYNLGLIIERLHQLRYHFEHENAIWKKPTAQSLQELHGFEGRFGMLPLVLHAWFETIGEVSLIGAHPKLSACSGLYRGSCSGPVSDPLGIGSDMKSWLRMTPSFLLEEFGTPPYSLILAPDADHKARTSGGGSTMIMFPNPVFDAPLTEEWEGIMLIPYLRTCFAWGGFPGLADDEDAAEAACEELAFLTKDLLPI